MIGSFGTWLFVSAVILNTGRCIDINSMELSPFYDAIIFGDIAEIINDIDNNMNFETDINQNSENESNEEVENLLLEYQHYLEKAEKQRAKYFEKTKIKNKVPLLRRERFSKVNFPKRYPNDQKSNYYPSNIQVFQKAYKHPYDFTPIQIAPSETLLPFNTIWKDNKMRDFPSPIQTPGSDAMLSSCFCEENKFPCKCNCKQCIIPLEKNIGTYFEPTKIPVKSNPLMTSNSYTNMGYFNDNIDNKSESNINIRIKFDIQMSKIDDVLKKIHNRLNLNKTTQSEDTDLSDSVAPMNLSLPSLNFPIPLKLFTYGVSKIHNYDYGPIHKISLHKKKKTHTNYQNKKHRNKFLSLHHGKGIPSQSIVTPEVYTNDSHNFNNVTTTSNDTELKINLNNTKALNSSSYVNISDVNYVDHSNILIKSTYGNISNEDNIVEVDTTTQISHTNYIKLEENNVTEISQLIRMKREVKLATIDNDTLSNSDLLKVIGLNNSQSEREIAKKLDSQNKQLLLDSDLLYWQNKTGISASNLTSITQQHTRVLFNQDLNVSEYTMNLNTAWHKSLNKINWNDIDIAASTYSSLVGKYVNGILTFCSEKSCRSIKCAEKICVHRSCSLEERYNQRGHCNSAPNDTDSTVSMESTLDVSFDIACELVETLQNQMLGLTYGKATICVNVKCITMLANKKVFTKTKCSKKQLNAQGHCEGVKNPKTV